MNPWEELLASIKEEADRQALEGVASKHPELKNGWLRQSDYSRKMDGLKKQEDYIKMWEEWEKDNWVRDAYGAGLGASKRELEKDVVIQDLQKRIETGGEVTLEELNRTLDAEITRRGVVTKDSFDGTLKEKETGLRGYVDAWGDVNMDMLRAVQKHGREFGEDLDPREVLKFGQENRKATFMEAYESFVAERRQKAIDEKHQKELEAARAEGKDEALKEIQGNRGVMPVDDGEPQIGNIQKFMIGTNKQDPADTSNLPLGKGAIAMVAAREFATKGAGG